MIALVWAALLALASGAAAASANPSPSTSLPTATPVSSAPSTAPTPITPSTAPTPSPIRSFLAPGSVPHANTWQNITPGSPFARVRAARGVSLLTRLLPDGSTVDWYPGPSDNAYIIVASRNDVVTYVRAFPVDSTGSMTGLTDPYGITPGDDANKLQARRGNPKEGRKLSDVAAVLLYPGVDDLLWLYEFDNGVVHAISLYDVRAAGAPPSAPPARDPRDGTTIGRAYVIHAPNEDVGVRFERYYATHRGGCSAWQITNQTLLSTGGREIDQIDIECADNKGQTSLFFDVTSFFGK